MGNEWVRFFAGSPRRALASLAGMFAIVGVIYPPAIGWTIRRLAEAFAPLVQLALNLLVIGIMIAGIGLMFRGLLGGGRGRSK